MDRYQSTPKLQRWNRWSLGMDKKFHPTLCNGCNYLSILGVKLNHVCVRGPRGTGWRWRSLFNSARLVYTSDALPYLGISFSAVHLHLVIKQCIIICWNTLQCHNPAVLNPALMDTDILPRRTSVKNYLSTASWSDRWRPSSSSPGLYLVHTQVDAYIISRQR